MKRYIARQPIFDKNMEVSGYELLYRGGTGRNEADVLDGDQATRSVLSDAMEVFGLGNLTNNRTAYINFTEGLLMDDFVLLADPKQVMIEILETVQISDRLIARLQELKERGYRLALDDYTGDSSFDEVLPLVDVIKVDFLLTDKATRAQIAERFRGSRVILLAEKVEDEITFVRARYLGYRLFQGYFFERPTPMVKEAPEISKVSAVRLMRELTKPEADLEACSGIIRTDAAMTYQLLKKVRTLQYYRGNSVQAIQQAVTLLGSDELQHWIILLMARGMNHTHSDESVRNAYVRGLFTERLLARSAFRARKSEGFLLGMFSVMERIMNMSMEEILQDIPLSEEVRTALLRTGENIFSQVLRFVEAYESSSEEELPALEWEITPEETTRLYMQSIQEADQAFSGE